MHPANPIFSVAVINDSHLRFDADDFGAARAKFSAVVADLQSGRHGAPPEVVIQLGDLVEESRRSDFKAALKILTPLSAKILHVPGNHDIAPDPEPWFDVLGSGLNGAFMHRGIMFITLNNAFADTAQTTETAARNEWFRDLLEHHPNTPKLIACHVPLVAFRDPEAIEKSFGYPSWQSLDSHNTLRHMIERHRGSVIAVVSAHVHLTGHVSLNGVHHFVASGTFSWPGDHLRLDFFPDRVTARMIPLEPFINSKYFAQFPLHNAAHDRHGIEFTDSNHRNFIEYIHGTGAERFVTIARNFQSEEIL